MPEGGGPKRSSAGCGPEPRHAARASAPYVPTVPCGRAAGRIVVAPLWLSQEWIIHWRYRSPASIPRIPLQAAHTARRQGKVLALAKLGAGLCEPSLNWHFTFSYLSAAARGGAARAAVRRRDPAHEATGRRLFGYHAQPQFRGASAGNRSDPCRPSHVRRAPLAPARFDPRIRCQLQQSNMVLLQLVVREHMLRTIFEWSGGGAQAP